ncbi:hypothetical protein C4J81_10270 [Deltaproteobacteria bacterium Smac51]|nr:hypothetical protein C4J81_03395 [Deltaproteobacteria bacterium Smac51]UQZ89568.1 hypothetical protein C4J81_10270 [Deltaproteobacteria bacterium Smac51]
MSRRQTKQWLAELHPIQFGMVWRAFSNQHHSQAGWMQVEILKRFPELTKWVDDLEDPEALIARPPTHDDDRGGQMINEPPGHLDNRSAKRPERHPSK